MWSTVSKDLRVYFVSYAWTHAEVKMPAASADTDDKLWMAVDTHCPPASLDKTPLASLCFLSG